MRRAWFWVLLPAVLIAVMQGITIPLVSRRLDIDALISFQAMLSSWPWLAMMSLGLDKQARELQSRTTPFGAFAGVWINVVVLAFVIGCATGIVGGFLFGNRDAWLLFCGVSALSGAMSPAREMFFARGKADWIGKVHAIALTASLVGLLACALAPLSLVVVAAVWVVPQCAAWAYVCWRADLHPGRPARLVDTLAALRSSLPFALQGAGFIALASFDVMILRGQLDDRELLDYILATRTVALAFLFSGALGNTLIQRTVGIAHRAWFRLLLTTFAVHATVSLCAVAALAIVGGRVFTQLIPGAEFRFSDGAVVTALCALALTRSFSEAALQMTGARTRRVALGVFVLSLFGVLQLVAWPNDDAVHAFRRIALGWGLPAVYLLASSFAKFRR